MKIDTHIAKRFLTDGTLKMEIIEELYPEVYEVLESDKDIPPIHKLVAGYQVEIKKETLLSRVASLYLLLDTPKGHKPYYCTETMLDCLEHLKINKTGEHYNWTYFSKLQNQVATFIFPDNAMLRMRVIDETIEFVHIKYTPHDKVRGNMHWIMFHLNRNTGELCEHFGHEDVKNIELFIYRLLCFVYMAENEEVIVAAGARYGTKKAGKLINSTPFPMTIINSKWNITSIRNEKFSVDAHFAIRHTGPGRTIPVVTLIRPYEKEGYIRRAKPENFNQNQESFYETRKGF